MLDIIAALRTDEAIAQWRAASSILTDSKGDVEDAKLCILAHVGHGLNIAEAGHLIHLVYRLTLPLLTPKEI